MGQRNTVNFLQIENALKAAIAHCEQAPANSFCQTQRQVVERALHEFKEQEERSDRAYLAWREAMRVRLLAAKHLWQCFEQIRSDLREYEIEPQPEGRKSYWDLPRFLEDVAALQDQLATLDQDEVFEIESWREELSQHRKAVERSLEEEDQALDDYRALLPARRNSLYRAVHAMDEFEVLKRDYRA